MTMKLRGCPKCGGDMWLDNETGVWDWVCLQCGCRIEIRRMPDRRRTAEVPDNPFDGVNPLAERSRFFREHKDEMLRDHSRLPSRTFMRRYGLAHGTWSNLKKRWREEEAARCTDTSRV